MMLKIRVPAAMPSPIALMLGPAMPRENIPKITEKKQVRMSPAL